MSSSIQEIEFGDFGNDGEVLEILKKDCSAVQIYWDRAVLLFENCDHGSSGPTVEEESPLAVNQDGETADGASAQSAAQPIWTGSEWTVVSTYSQPDPTATPSHAAAAESRVPNQQPVLPPATVVESGASHAPTDIYPKTESFINSHTMMASGATSLTQSNPDPYIHTGITHMGISHASNSTHVIGVHDKLSGSWQHGGEIQHTYTSTHMHQNLPYPHQHDHYRQPDMDIRKTDSYSSGDMNRGMSDQYQSIYADHSYGSMMPNDNGRPSSKLYEKTYERRNKKKKPRDYYEKFGIDTPNAPHMPGARYRNEGYQELLLPGGGMRNRMHYGNNQPGILGMHPGMMGMTYVVDTSVPPPGMMPVDITNLHVNLHKPNYTQTVHQIHNSQSYPNNNVYRQNSQEFQQQEYNDAQTDHMHQRQGQDNLHAQVTQPEVTSSAMYMHDTQTNGPLPDVRLVAPPGIHSLPSHLNVTEAGNLDTGVTMVTLHQSGSHNTATTSNIGVSADMQHDCQLGQYDPSHHVITQPVTVQQTAIDQHVTINQQTSHYMVHMNDHIYASAQINQQMYGASNLDKEVHPVPSAPPLCEMEPEKQQVLEQVTPAEQKLKTPGNQDEWTDKNYSEFKAELGDEGLSFLGEPLPSVDISTEKNDIAITDKTESSPSSELQSSTPLAQSTPEKPTPPAGQDDNQDVPIATVTDNNDTEAALTDDSKVTAAAATLTDNSGVEQNQSKPKTTSWAGLFKKNSGTPSTGIVVYNYDAPSSTAPSLGSEERQSQEKEQGKDALPQTVPTAEDKAAKQLGEFLLDCKLNHKSVSLQPRGLVNKANWCYVNATLQALLACPPFYHLLKSLPAVRTNDGAPSSTPVMDSLVQFVSEFNTMPPLKGQDRGSGNKGNRMPGDLPLGPPFEPSYVYKMLQVIQYDAAFKHGKQEDAEEFLSCLLNGLHEEMVAATKFANTQNGVSEVVGGKPNGEMPSSPSGASLEDEDEESGTEGDDQWERVGPRNKSVITRTANFQKSPASNIFGGQIRSLLHKQGLKESATLQPFYTLQLDIQNEKVFTLKDALDALVSKESIHGFTCSKTKKEVEASRRITLEELPSILVLHLKCMVYDKSGGIQKIFKKIDFDVTLDINKDLLSPSARSRYSQNQRIYKLLAVVSHHGSRAVGGHYTTDYFHPGLNGWVQADDSNIKLVSLPSVLKFVPSRVPYLILYRRADLI